MCVFSCLSREKKRAGKLRIFRHEIRTKKNPFPRISKKNPEARNAPRDFLLLSESKHRILHIETFVAIAKFVWAAILVPVKSVSSRFLIAFKAEESRIPANGTIELACNIEQTAQSVGACPVIHGSNGIFVVAYGIYEILHVGRTYLILTFLYFLLFLLDERRVGALQITARTIPMHRALSLLAIKVGLRWLAAIWSAPTRLSSRRKSRK